MSYPAPSGLPGSWTSPTMLTDGANVNAARGATVAQTMPRDASSPLDGEAASSPPPATESSVGPVAASEHTSSVGHDTVSTHASAPVAVPGAPVRPLRRARRGAGYSSPMPVAPLQLEPEPESEALCVQRSPSLDTGSVSGSVSDHAATLTPLLNAFPVPTFAGLDREMEPGLELVPENSVPPGSQYETTHHVDDSEQQFESAEEHGGLSRDESSDEPPGESGDQSTIPFAYHLRGESDRDSGSAIPSVHGGDDDDGAQDDESTIDDGDEHPRHRFERLPEASSSTVMHAQEGVPSSHASDAPQNALASQDTVQNTPDVTTVSASEGDTTSSQDPAQPEPDSASRPTSRLLERRQSGLKELVLVSAKRLSVQSPSLSAEHSPASPANWSARFPSISPKSPGFTPTVPARSFSAQQIQHGSRSDTPDSPARPQRSSIHYNRSTEPDGEGSIPDGPPGSEKRDMAGPAAKAIQDAESRRWPVGKANSSPAHAHTNLPHRSTASASSLPLNAPPSTWHSRYHDTVSHWASRTNSNATEGAAAILNAGAETSTLAFPSVEPAGAALAGSKSVKTPEEERRLEDLLENLHNGQSVRTGSVMHQHRARSSGSKSMRDSFSVMSSASPRMRDPDSAPTGLPAVMTSSFGYMSPRTSPGDLETTPSVPVGLALTDPHGPVDSTWEAAPLSQNAWTGPPGRAPVSTSGSPLAESSDQRESDATAVPALQSKGLSTTNAAVRTSFPMLRASTRSTTTSPDTSGQWPRRYSPPSSSQVTSPPREAPAVRAQWGSMNSTSTDPAVASDDVPPASRKNRHTHNPSAQSSIDTSLAREIRRQRTLLERQNQELEELRRAVADLTSEVDSRKSMTIPESEISQSTRRVRRSRAASGSAGDASRSSRPHHTRRQLYFDDRDFYSGSDEDALSPGLIPRRSGTMQRRYDIGEGGSEMDEETSRPMRPYVRAGRSTEELRPRPQHIHCVERKSADLPRRPFLHRDPAPRLPPIPSQDWSNEAASRTRTVSAPSGRGLHAPSGEMEELMEWEDPPHREPRHRASAKTLHQSARPSPQSSFVSLPFADQDIRPPNGDPGGYAFPNAGPPGAVPVWYPPYGSAYPQFGYAIADPTTLAQVRASIDGTWSVGTPYGPASSRPSGTFGPIFLTPSPQYAVPPHYLNEQDARAPLPVAASAPPVHQHKSRFARLWLRSKAAKATCLSDASRRDDTQPVVPLPTAGTSPGWYILPAHTGHAPPAQTDPDPTRPVLVAPVTSPPQAATPTRGATMLQKVRTLTARTFSARQKTSEAADPGSTGPSGAARTSSGPAPIHVTHQLNPSVTRGSARSVPASPGPNYLHANSSGPLMPSDHVPVQVGRRRSEPRNGRASASVSVPVPAVPAHSTPLGPRLPHPSVDGQLAMPRTDSPESLYEVSGLPPASPPPRRAPHSYGSKQTSWAPLPSPSSAHRAGSSNQAPWSPAPAASSLPRPFAHAPHTHTRTPAKTVSTVSQYSAVSEEEEEVQVIGDRENLVFPIPSRS